MNQKHLIAAIVVVALTVGLNFLVPVPGEYVPQGARISTLIPLTMGDWSSEGDLGVSEDVKRILGTDDIINRYYTRPGSSERILLSLVFSAGHRHSMHPPEVCYQAQGHTMVGRNFIEVIPGCEVTVLNLTDGGGRETLVNYWFFSEGKETPSYMWHQVHLVMNQVMFQSQPSVLLRFSTQVENSNRPHAQELLADFGKAAIPLIREKLPSSQNPGPEVTVRLQ